MINVSDRAKAIIEKGVGYYREYVTLTLSDDTVLSLTEANLWEGGLSFESEISNGEDFQIGSAMVEKCDIVICNIDGEFDNYDFKDAKAVVSIGIEDSDIIRKGCYVVNEMRYNGSIITLSCLDYMTKFDVAYSDVTTTYPTTFGRIVQDICSHVSVPLYDSTFYGYDTAISDRPAENDMTCRQVIAYIAQATNQHAKMDSLGRLIFIRPNFSSLDILGNISLNLHSIFSMTVSTSNVVVTGISAKRTVNNSDGETEEESAIYGTSGYVLSISENPFISNLQATVNYIGPQIVGHAFRPLECMVLSNPIIEVGDVFKLTDRKGNVYASIATLVRFRTGHSTFVQCSAKSPLKNAVDRPSILTQTVLQSETRTNERMSSYQMGQSLLSNLMSNAIGFYTTEETLPNGSKIVYQHDKPTLAQSTIIYKRTVDAFTFSNDGGATWNSGWTASGDAVFNIIQAVGISASWIETGRLEVKDTNNNTMFLVDVDTGQVIFNLNRVLDNNGVSASTIIDDTNDNIQEQLTAANDNIATNANAIGALETQNVSVNADITGLEQRVSGVEHGMDGLDKQITTAIETKLGEINFIFGTRTDVAELKKYIRFDNGDILIGRSDTDLVLKLQNDRISFISGGAEVAYISDSRLYISDAIFLKSVQIGNFGFVPRSNGNLSFTLL